MSHSSNISGIYRKLLTCAIHQEHRVQNDVYLMASQCRRQNLGLMPKTYAKNISPIEEPCCAQGSPRCHKRSPRTRESPSEPDKMYRRCHRCSARHLQSPSNTRTRSNLRLLGRKSALRSPRLGKSRRCCVFDFEIHVLEYNKYPPP